jgi:hypothetical protein
MDYRGQPIDKVITDIDTSYNHYGLLTRLDRVLALAKKGFDDADIEYGLRHFIAMCPNKSFQKVLKTTYGVSR